MRIMVHKMFCIFDGKAMAYLPPFCLPEVGMASRTFGDCINSKDHQFGLHPEDYTLFQIGVYDDSTGIVSELNTRCVVANGVELKLVEVRPDQGDLPLNGGDSPGAPVSEAVDAKLAAIIDSIGDKEGL